MRRASNDDTAYVAVNRFRLDDLRPYVYLTRDGGKHWTDRRRGFPTATGKCRPRRSDRHGPAVRCDGERASTFRSTTAHRGSRCSSTCRTPRYATSDRPRQRLVVATHGRGFWILDDVVPLARTRARRRARQLRISSRPRRPIACAAARTPTRRCRRKSRTGRIRPTARSIDYYSTRRRLRTSRSRSATPAGRSCGGTRATIALRRRSPTSINRRIGNDRSFAPETERRNASLRLGSARAGADIGRSETFRSPRYSNDTPRVPQGALVVPGRYTVELQADGARATRPLTVVMDPRVSISAAALREQYALAHDVASLIERTYAAIARAQASGTQKTVDRLPISTGASRRSSISSTVPMPR